MGWFDNGFKAAPKPVKVMTIIFAVIFAIIAITVAVNVAKGAEIDTWNLCGNWEDSNQKGEVIEFECLSGSNSVLVKILPLTFDVERTPPVERESWVCLPFLPLLNEKFWQLECRQVVPTDEYATTGLPNINGQKAIFSDQTIFAQIDVTRGHSEPCTSPLPPACRVPSEMLMILPGAGIWSLDNRVSQ